MSQDWERFLESIYSDPKEVGSFTSPQKLYRTLRERGRTDITIKQIRTWMSSQDGYALHRPARRNFRRNIVIVSGIDSEWDSDLAELSSISKYNDGYSFILVVIDIFSRYAFTRPLKTKRSVEVAKQFQNILQTSKRKPKVLRTDPGGEYVNKTFAQLLSKYGINHLVTSNEKKANYVEIFIKSLKGRIQKYMTQMDSYRWIDSLSDDLTSTYNLTYHRGIKMKPADVNSGNEQYLWLKQYYSPKTISDYWSRSFRYKYKIGDNVKVSHLRTIFDREYTVRIFIIIPLGFQKLLSRNSVVASFIQ